MLKPVTSESDVRIGTTKSIGSVTQITGINVLGAEGSLNTSIRIINVSSMALNRLHITVALRLVAVIFFSKRTEKKRKTQIIGQT